MKKITFEIRSWLRVTLDLKEYPELTSKKRFIRKGINILRQHTPKILRYLSRQQVLANLSQFEVEIEAGMKTKEKKVRRIFKLWIQKEKSKRLVCLVVEGIALPFSGFLALVPGPNFFFYGLALLFYYHLISYLGLKKIDADTLKISIRRRAKIPK